MKSMRHGVIVPLAFCLFLVSQARAQVPSFIPFGQGCGGGSALPSLDGAHGSLPTIDDRFTVLLKDLPFRTADNPGATLIVLGFSTSQWMGLALPLDLASHGAPGCTWYVSGNQVFSQTYSGDSATWTVSIQNDPGLLGMHFFNQGVILDAGANLLGLVTTNAAEGVIGLNRGPEASIVFPPPRSLTHKDSVVVRGTASDRDGIAEVRVNNQFATSSDGFANWKVTVPLFLGSTTLVVRTEDNLGFVNRQEDLVQIESQARITSPEAIAFDPVSNSGLVAVNSGIVSVDPETGNRRILSNNIHGSGITFSQPRGIAIDGNRLLVTARTRTSAVVEVDLATGNRRLISDDSIVASLPSLSSPRGIVRQRGEALVVVEGFDQQTFRHFGSIIALDLLTGNRRVVSAPVARGVGRLLESNGIALDGNRALITEAITNHIFAVDLLTGDRSVFSGGLFGSGPQLAQPRDLVVDGNHALVVGKSFAGVFAVDLATGNRSVVSDASRGGGPNFMTPWAITKAGNSALVLDRDLEAVLSIDLATGNRAVLSKSSNGTGPVLLGQTAVSLD